MVNRNKKRTILVTGGSGIVGQHVIKNLQSSSHLVEIKCFDGDILNVDNIQEQIRKLEQLDEVIHLAASVAVEKVKENPAKAFAINVGGTCNLLEGIISCGLKPHFFLASSAHVYSPSVEPIREDAKLCPSSIYGKTKLMSEIAASEICSQAGIALCVGRIFSIYDHKQKGTFLLPNIIRRLNSENLDEVFDLYGGESVRDFLTARQVAKYILELSRCHYAGVINIASGKPTKIKDFVQGLSEIPIKVRSLGESNTIIANTEKLSEFLRGKFLNNV